MSPSSANSAFSSGSAQVKRLEHRLFARETGVSLARTGSLTRLVVQAPDRDWRPQVKSRLEELIRLPTGWDGYRGLPVSLSTAEFALLMLDGLCPSGTPVPSIVPGVDGDVQVEWHTEKGDIELHVLRPNSVHAWRQTDHTGDDGEEVELTIDFRPILSWIQELSEPAVAADAAAA